MRLITYLKGRLNERSTWAFWLAGIAAVAALPSALWQAIGGVTLFCTGLVPDGPVKGGQ